ncbi:MAG: ATP-binding protein [Spirochaetaceae bacterium]
MPEDRGDSVATPIKSARSLRLIPSRRARLGILLMSYCLALAIIAGSMLVGYRSQVDLRTDERTREITVAYDSVISTLAAAPELFYALIASDSDVTSILQEANRADDDELDRLNRELFLLLSSKYKTLQERDFRQLHFHLRDNRSFLRFHRPDRFGDDLTDIRPTVRLTNERLEPTYAFEEGRIYNGFRYVYPVFHEGEHAGSVEVSMNYRALISRMQVSRPGVFDFLMVRDVVESMVFEGELGNYEPSCFSGAFLRETAFEQPDTQGVIGVDFSCISEDTGQLEQLLESLDDFRATTVAFMVNGVPAAVSALPVRNIADDPVALILGYTRFDEIIVLRRLFGAIGLALVLLTSTAFFLFTRVVRAHDRLVHLSRDMQRTMQEKDRFFSIVSHDLRGPVGSLAGLASLLRDRLKELPGLPANAHEIADVLAEGAANSSRLLDDLLDWSRSQRGDLAFRPTLVSLDDIIEDQCSLLRQAAHEKDISFSQDNRGLRVYADEYMIGTILRNLLANAIKFTPDGGNVSVETQETTAGVTVAVTDTGVGMTEQQQRDIFELSVKSSTRGTRAESGTGLGLAVCREFVAAHKGRLEVDSGLGVGTRFTIFFPNKVF